MDDSAWSRWSAYEAVSRALSVQLCGTMWSYADDPQMDLQDSSRFAAWSKVSEQYRLQAKMLEEGSSGWWWMQTRPLLPQLVNVCQCWFMDPEPGPLWTLITAIWKDSSRVLGKVLKLHEITFNFCTFWQSPPGQDWLKGFYKSTSSFYINLGR